MGTNNINQKTIRFYLEEFSILEKVILINILIIKFNINCSLKSKNKQDFIYISEKETKNLLLVLAPYFLDISKPNGANFLAKPFKSRSKNIVIHKKGFHTSSTQYYSISRNRLERGKIILPQNLKDILVGLILGDLYMQKSNKSINPNLQFEQGIVNKDYLFHLYDLFKDYCKPEPKISERKPDSRTNKIYSRVRFNTYHLPCFNELYDLFYVEGKKGIPLNIEELITPIGLAY